MRFFAFVPNIVKDKGTDTSSLNQDRMKTERKLIKRIGRVKNTERNLMKLIFPYVKMNNLILNPRTTFNTSLFIFN